MKCPPSCLLIKPPQWCVGDCEKCEYNSSTEFSYPCCTCLNWEAIKNNEETTELHGWLKGQLMLYHKIVHEGPIDKYTIHGEKRLLRVFTIATRISERMVQKKTQMEIDDKELYQHITHYTTLYKTTTRFQTADNYDSMEEVLTEAHIILHDLMIFLNTHLNLNYNLQPQPQTETGPTPKDQIARIKDSLKAGGQPTSL